MAERVEVEPLNVTCVVLSYVPPLPWIPVCEIMLLRALEFSLASAAPKSSGGVMVAVFPPFTVTYSVLPLAT